MIVSNEGFALWGRSSDAAFKSRRFIRTKNTVYELPPAATAARREYTEATKAGTEQQSERGDFPKSL
jgi:hypothetical protein